MKICINKFVAVLMAFIFLCGALQVPVSASGKLPLDSGHLRFIKNDYWDTLPENSKWRSDELHTSLSKALSSDLSDTSDCAQVWRIPAKYFKDIHDWCRTQNKGTQTNQEFLIKFSSFREQ